MKLIIILGICACALLLSFPCHAQQYVQTITRGGCNGTGTTACAAFPNPNFTAGDTSMIFIACQGSTTCTPSVTGTQGKTYTQIATCTDSTNRLAVFEADNMAFAPETPTVAPGSGISFFAIGVEFSGLAVSAFDQTACAGLAGSVTSPSSGNTPTTTSANELVVGFMNNVNITFTPGAGYTAVPYSSGGLEQMVEYKTVSSTGAYAATATMPSTGSPTEIMAITLKTNIVPQTPMMVFAGDSITVGAGQCGVTLDSQSWPAQAMPLPWFQISSTSTREMAAHQGWQVSNLVTQYPSMVKVYKPNASNITSAYLFTAIGTNDMANAFGDESAATFTAAVEAYWATARADGFKIVAFTIMPTGFITGSQETQRQLANTTIRGASVDWDYLIDLDADALNLVTTNSCDNTHLNATGYVAYADFVNGSLPLAQQTYTARTDVNLQAYPTPIPCPYNGTGCSAGVGSATGANYALTPTDFNTEIIRATDVNSGGPQPSYGTSCSGSGEVNLWDINDTRFAICSDGGEEQVESFNPSTNAVATLYPTQGPASDGALGGCSSNAEFLAGTTLFFSLIHPDIAYGESFLSNGDTAICQWDLASATTMPTYSNSGVTSVVDLSTCVSALAGVGYGTYADDVNVSADDQTFAALGSTTVGQGSSGSIYVIIWNRNAGCRVWNTGTGAVTGSWGTTGTISLTDTFLIHNIRISKNGQYVKVIQNTCTGGGCTSNSNIYIWDVATLTVNRIINDGTLGCGHSTIGWTETMNLCSGYWVRAFTSNDQSGTNPVSSYPSPNSNQDGHAGFNNGNSTDTAPVFWAKAPENTPGSGLFAPVNGWDNEINAVRLDGSGTVYRFAHTYATYDDTDNFDGEYAIGNVSPDGKFYAWASDWDGMLGVLGGGSNTCTIGTNCRTDVFIALLTGSAAPSSAPSSASGNIKLGGNILFK